MKTETFCQFPAPSFGPDCPLNDSDRAGTLSFYGEYNACKSLHILHFQSMCTMTKVYSKPKVELTFVSHFQISVQCGT